MRFRPTVTNLYQIWQANSTCLISASLNDLFCGAIWATERQVLDKRLVPQPGTEPREEPGYKTSK